MVSVEDTAYTAGLMDGEGSVSLAIHHGKVSKIGLPNNSPMLLVQISMTDRGVIEWLLETWEIGSMTQSYRPKQPHHLPAWGWRIYGASAEGFLHALLPFLRVKKAQAELGIRSRKGTLPSKKIGEAEMRRRLAVRDEMIALNGTLRRTKIRPWSTGCTE